MRKVIQISISESSEDSSQWCLCDDGTMWQYMGPVYEKWDDFKARVGADKTNTSEKLLLKPLRWEKIVGVPQGETESKE